MSSDRDALTAAVAADPDDDTVRLVFADWLDDHDEPDRAAFIRHQVEQARLEPFSPPWRAAGAAADRLLAAHRAAWVRPLGGRLLRAAFVRGFVEAGEADAARLPVHAADLFAHAPLRRLKLFRSRGARGRVPLAPAFDLSVLSRLTHLDLSYTHPAEDELDALLLSPHLTGLRGLALGENPLSPSAADTLLRSARLPALADLDLGGAAHLGPTVAAALPDCPHRALARLNLRGVRVDLGQSGAVLSAACVAGLEALSLANSERGAPLGPRLGWQLASAGLPELRELDLTGQMVGEAGVGALTVGLLAGSLRRLVLARNGVSAAGVRHLTACAGLHLYELDLRDNPLGLSDAAALRARFPDAVVRT